MRFDKVFLDKIIERVAALHNPQLNPAVKEAFNIAYDNIYAFHYAQKALLVKVENMKGVRCKRVSRCITSVGLYVPRGTTVLPSTALMLAVMRLIFCLFCTSLHRLQDAKLLFWILRQENIAASAR
ncbi:hypothetical protein MKX03_019698 [Papaver bracteatum]|nr:hypothetical protein MKX03_019698 [Papaver bracteatum]